ADGQRRLGNDLQFVGGYQDSLTEGGAEALGHLEALNRLLHVDVDVVEIAAGSGAESGDVVLAEGLPQGLLQITGVISAVECPPDGVRVHREDRSAGEKLLLL